MVEQENTYNFYNAEHAEDLIDILIKTFIDANIEKTTQAISAAAGACTYTGQAPAVCPV